MRPNVTAGVPVPPAPAASPRRRRHCLVTVDGHQEPHEGLVLTWRYDAATGAWSALVAYATEDDQTITAWLPATQLRPGTTKN